MSGKLTYHENLTFLNSFMEEAHSASPETMTNALIHLGKMVIQTSAEPGLDIETVEIMACFMAHNAIKRCSFDLEKNVREGEHDAAIIQNEKEDGPVQ